MGPVRVPQGQTEVKLKLDAPFIVFKKPKIDRSHGGSERAWSLADVTQQACGPRLGWGGRKPESQASASPLKGPGKVLTLLGACFSICKMAVDMSSASFKLF